MSVSDTESDADSEPESLVTEIDSGDPVTLRADADVAVDVVETIPMVRDRAQRAQPFAVRVSDLDAFPNQRYEFQFEYNRYMQRWLFDAYHLDTERRLFTGPNVATLGRTYSDYPYLMCRFIAPTAHPTPDRISPENLGATVHLAVAPGPAGGSFPASAGLTQAEEDALLRRDTTTYPIGREWV